MATSKGAEKGKTKNRQKGSKGIARQTRERYQKVTAGRNARKQSETDRARQARQDNIARAIQKIYETAEAYGIDPAQLGDIDTSGFGTLRLNKVSGRTGDAYAAADTANQRASMVNIQAAKALPKPDKATGGGSGGGGGRGGSGGGYSRSGGSSGGSSGGGGVGYGLRGDVVGDTQHPSRFSGEYTWPKLRGKAFGNNEISSGSEIRDVMHSIAVNLQAQNPALSDGESWRLAGQYLAYQGPPGVAETAVGIAEYNADLADALAMDNLVKSHGDAQPLEVAEPSVEFLADDPVERMWNAREDTSHFTTAGHTVNPDGTIAYRDPWDVSDDNIPATEAELQAWNDNPVNQYAPLPIAAAYDRDKNHIVDLDELSMESQDMPGTFGELELGSNPLDLLFKLGADPKDIPYLDAALNTFNTTPVDNWNFRGMPRWRMSQLIQAATQDPSLAAPASTAMKNLATGVTDRGLMPEFMGQVGVEDLYSKAATGKPAQYFSGADTIPFDNPMLQLALKNKVSERTQDAEVKLGRPLTTGERAEIQQSIYNTFTAGAVGDDWSAEDQDTLYSTVFGPDADLKGPQTLEGITDTNVEDKTRPFAGMLAAGGTGAMIGGPAGGLLGLGVGALGGALDAILSRKPTSSINMPNAQDEYDTFAEQLGLKPKIDPRSKHYGGYTPTPPLSKGGSSGAGGGKPDKPWGVLDSLGVRPAPQPKRIKPKQKKAAKKQMWDSGQYRPGGF